MNQFLKINIKRKALIVKPLYFTITASKASNLQLEDVKACLASSAHCMVCHFTDHVKVVDLKLLDQTILENGILHNYLRSGLLETQQFR